MDALDLEGLEEITGQTSTRANEITRRIPRGGLFGWHASPNIERASAAHECKPIEKPAASTPAARLDKDERGIAPADTIGREQEITIISEPVTSYSEMIGVIRTRVGQLGVRYLDSDKLAGWAEGLSGKAFGASEVKRLGPEKMFDALRGAGLRLRVEIDPEQTRKMQARIAENYLPRQATQARFGNSANLSNKTIDGVLDFLANKKSGGLTRLNKAVKQARANHARRTIAIGVNWQQRSTAMLALPPPDREALDTCAEEEATAA